MPEKQKDAEGANSGVSKSSSTVSDQGPVTTQATPKGNPIVNEEGGVSKETGGNSATAEKAESDKEKE